MPAARGLCPACRQTLLSRYNHDPLCGPCMRAAVTAPPQEVYGPPTWLWDSALWREALARADLPVALAVFRGASGLSQHALAEIVGWSQSTLSLFERGQRDTLWDIRVWLHIVDAVDMPRVALLPLVFGRVDAALPDRWSADVTQAGDPLADVGVLEDADVDVDRRGFGGLAAGAAASAALPLMSVPAQVSAAHVRYLRTCADSLNRRDQDVGGAALLQQGLRQWQRARRMLDESSYTETIGRELLGVAGSLAVCSGWLAFDGGNLALARRLYSEALLLAGSVYDPVLTAHVLEKSSMLSSYVARMDGKSGPAREGLRLADQAAEVARHESMPRLHALIALRRANATSILGDKLAFRSAMSRARTELDRGPREGDPEWIRFVDEFEVSGQEAMGHMNLGDPRTSAVVHQDSLEQPDLPPRNRACAQAQLASALAASGDVDSAVSSGMTVLSALADGVTSVRTLNYLRSVRVAAEGTAAEEFCARFDSVERTLTAQPL